MKLPWPKTDPVVDRLSRGQYVIQLSAKDKRFWGRYAGVAAVGFLFGLCCMQAASAWLGVGNVVASRHFQSELARVQGDAKLSELRAQQEAATREALTKELEAQTQKLRQVEQELVFFRTQRGTPARGVR